MSEKFVEKELVALGIYQPLNAGGYGSKSVSPHERICHALMLVVRKWYVKPLTSLEVPYFLGFRINRFSPS